MTSGVSWSGLRQPTLFLRLNLDLTLEDLDSAKSYLARMLDSMAERVGLQEFCSGAFNPDGLLQLTLASGGVPRDYLSIFVEAIQVARERRALRWLTPKTIYKGAARVVLNTKLSNLRDDLGTDATPAETVFRDLLKLCLKEKKKTAFLIDQEGLLRTSPPQQHQLEASPKFGPDANGI
jgi:hypothetical protein